MARREYAFVSEPTPEWSNTSFRFINGNTPNHIALTVSDYSTVRNDNHYDYTYQVKHSDNTWDNFVHVVYSGDDTIPQLSGTSKYALFSVQLQAGDTLYIKGNNPLGFSQPTQYAQNPVSLTFYSESSLGGGNPLECHGSIMNLIDNESGSVVIPTDSRFWYAFRDLKITTAPELPATTLTEFCYYWMFYGCTQLTTVPSLPATTLQRRCYESMFYGCTALTTISNMTLGATILSEQCYDNMFSNCSNITNTPVIAQFTSVSSSSCRGMFKNCQSLQTISSNITIASAAQSTDTNCYYEMFYNCTSLTHTIKFTTISMTPYMCSYMYYNCTNLTTIQIVGTRNPTFTLSSNSCSHMFDRCTNLSTDISAIQLAALDSTATHCCDSMFIKCTSLTHSLSTNWSSSIIPEYAFYRMYYDCTSLTTGMSFTATSVLSSACYEMYRGCSRLTNSGAVRINDLSSGTYNLAYMYNACITLNTNDVIIRTTAVSNYACYYMYYFCEKLTTPASMPNVTQCGAYSFSYMYARCTKLNVVMDIQGITDNINSHSFAYMYQECTSLTDAGTMSLNPASTGEYCCNRMFSECTNLVTANNIVIKGTQPYSYNSMFYQCSNLVQLPLINTLMTPKNNSFQAMFQQCTSITEMCDIPMGSNLSTASSYCYSAMFYGCTQLKFIKLIEINTTLVASAMFNQMFYGCTNIIKYYDENNTLQEGIKIKITGTRLQNASSLFARMFENCTSITKAEIYAPNITVTYSNSGAMLKQLFKGCSSLVNITYRLLNSPNNFTRYTGTNSTFYNWVSGVGASGQFGKKSSTATSYGVNAIPSGWTVVSI